MPNHIPDKREGGATLVEFTLVAALLFALVGGLIEFSHVVRRYTQLVSILNATARFTVAQPNNCEEQARKQFDALLDKSHLSDMVVTLSGTLQEQSTGPNLLALKATIEIPCALCGYVLNPSDYGLQVLAQKTVVYPMEWSALECEDWDESS